MASHNFTTTISVDQTPEGVFKAINNVRGWWSEEIEGTTNKLGAEFTYHYEDTHRCKMKIVELVRDKKVVWLVLDNFFNFTEDKTEWKGTKVVFEVSRKDGKTQLRFTHEGLVPAYECFNICSNAWGLVHKWQPAKLDRDWQGASQPEGKDDAKETFSMNPNSREAKNRERDAKIDRSLALYRAADTQDLSFAKIEAPSPRGVASRGGKRVAAHPHSKASHLETPGIGRQEGDRFEARCCRVFVDATGQDSDRAPWRHGPPTARM